MTDLLPFAVIQLGVSLSLAAILLLVYRRIQREEFLPFWALYWLVIALTVLAARMIGLFFPAGSVDGVAPLYVFLLPFGPVLMVCAALSVGGGMSRRAARNWLFGAAAFGVLACVFLSNPLSVAPGSLVSPSRLSRILPIVRPLTNALAIYFFAFRLAVEGQRNRLRAHKVLVALAVVYGTHNLGLSGILGWRAYGSDGYSAWSATIGILLQFALTIVFTLSAIEHAEQARIKELELGRELQLTEHRRRILALALESSDECVGIADTDGRLVYANKAFIRTYGYREEELIGQSIMKLRSPRNPPDLPEGIIAAVKAGGWRGEVLNMTKDGRELPVSLIASGVFDEEGNLTALIGLSHDITAQKQSEAERLSLEVRLAESQKMEAIGRLAGGVAHDFNNMLTVILGYAFMGRDKVALDSPIARYLAEIEKAASRSRLITQKLLGFSRQQIIAPAPSNLNDLVEDLLEPLARLIREDIKVNFCPGDDLWTVLVDPSQVNQLLLNLVVNARDAMPSGGALTIETKNVTTSEEYCRANSEALPGDFVALAVTDTGVGIEAEVLPRIFEPFFTTKGKDEGTGLGLSMVYGIARQNGGFVQVYSQPKQGSTFRIFIPRLTGEEPVQTEPDIAAAVAAGSGKVLVVEDDELVRELVTSSLESVGYTPVPVARPTQAIELCSSAEGSGIRLVLTDVVMPEMNGMELRDRICAVNPGMRVLFMSGYTPNVIVKRGVLKPGVHFIQKPFTIEELSRRIEEVLAAI